MRGSFFSMSDVTFAFIYCFFFGGGVGKKEVGCRSKRAACVDVILLHEEQIKRLASSDSLFTSRLFPSSPTSVPPPPSRALQ